VASYQDDHGKVDFIGLTLSTRRNYQKCQTLRNNQKKTQALGRKASLVSVGKSSIRLIMIYDIPVASSMRPDCNCPGRIVTDAK
jgi:hypothetical protein